MVNSPMALTLPEENVKAVMSKQPLGFIPTDDVASLNAYLLSSAADMITGRGFDIDGGSLCYV